MKRLRGQGVDGSVLRTCKGLRSNPVLGTLWQGHWGINGFGCCSGASIIPGAQAQSYLEPEREQQVAMEGLLRRREALNVRARIRVQRAPLAVLRRAMQLLEEAEHRVRFEPVTVAAEPIDECWCGQVPTG